RLPQPATSALDRVREWPGGAWVLKPSLCDGARYIEVVHGLEEAHARVAEWRADETRGGERRGAALLQEWVREPACVRLFATPTSAATDRAPAPSPAAAAPRAPSPAAAAPRAPSPAAAAPRAPSPAAAASRAPSPAAAASHAPSPPAARVAAEGLVHGAGDAE